MHRRNSKLGQPRVLEVQRDRRRTRSFRPRRDSRLCVYKAFRLGVGFLSAATRQPPELTTHREFFNPGAGFLPAATVVACSPLSAYAQFQSRCGFSPGCNPSSELHESGRDEVSIPVRVFSRLQPPMMMRSVMCFCVSIPVRVFSRLQPYSSRLETASTSCFNPGAGFLPAATPSRSPARRQSICFNPGAGFLPAAT